jgi:hypothetical protein
MKKANVMRVLGVAALFASLSPIACGSDSGKGNGSNTNGTGGKASTGQDAGPPPATIPPGSVGCGSNVCSVPTGVTGTACCLDAFQSICGVTMMAPFGGTSSCAKAPPPAATDCPALQTTFLRNCCTTDSKCGVDTSMFGGGCTSYDDFRAMTAMYSRGFDAGARGMMYSLTLPPEQSCTPMM